MSVLETILGIFTVLFGGLNVFQFIFIKSTKKKFDALADKEKNEADVVAAEADSKAVATLKDVIDELRKDYANLDSKYESVVSERDLLREERYLATCHMCLHMGCILRRPEAGKGKQWLDDHHGDPTIGADFKPIDVLLEEFNSGKQ